MMLIVSLLSTIMILVAAKAESHPRDDVGTYGTYNTWRQAVCEKNDQDLLKDLDACYKKENPICIKTVAECMSNADPSSNGDSIAYTNAACQDLSLFAKFDECIEKYEQDEEVSKHLELTREDFRLAPIFSKSDNANECYSAILTKYNMDDLQEYLKKELKD